MSYELPGDFVQYCISIEESVENVILASEARPESPVCLVTGFDSGQARMTGIGHIRLGITSVDKNNDNTIG